MRQSITRKIKGMTAEEYLPAESDLAFEGRIMPPNEWLYVFGFATHILRFKAIQPIGKTDIYNVLAVWCGF